MKYIRDNNNNNNNNNNVLGDLKNDRKTIIEIQFKESCHETFQHKQNNDDFITLLLIPGTRKYWVDVQREIVSSHGERDLL